MIEYKFRIWDMSCNKMWNIVQVGCDDITVPTVWCDKRRDWFHVAREEAKIMQYIGVKDCNGKEIYVGDILEVTHKRKNSKEKIIGKVIFGSFARYQLTGKNIHCSFDKIFNYELKVIGNIYENKELLDLL